MLRQLVFILDDIAIFRSNRKRNFLIIFRIMSKLQNAIVGTHQQVDREAMFVRSLKSLVPILKL